MPRGMHKRFEPTELSYGERVILERLHEMQRADVNTNTRLMQIMATLDDLLANARAMDTRLDSVRALINDMRSAAAEVKMPADAQKKIDELFALMENNAGEVTQALQPPGHVEPAPTPVEPTPAPAVTEPIGDTPLGREKEA